MARARLTWAAPVALPHDGYRVFRATSPFNVETLPEPVAELLPDVTEYIDDDPELDGGHTYYYRVSAFSDDGDDVDPTSPAHNWCGPLQAVETVESLPFLVDCTTLVAGTTATSFTRKIPDSVREGDAIVLFGTRRAAITSPPSGYTDAGAVPAPNHGGSGTDEWAFALWKIADGSEGGTDVTIGMGASALGGFSVAVFRHPSKPCKVTTLALQRNASAGNTALAVTNSAKRCLLFVCSSYTTATTGVIQGWSSRAFVPSWVASTDPPGVYRNVAFLTRAEPNENVSISFTTTGSSNAYRSQIWLQLEADDA